MEATKKKGTYTTEAHAGYKFEIKCSLINGSEGDPDLEIRVVKPKGRVWVGIVDIQKVSSNDNFESSSIKRAIRHAHSYRGGASYGNYGGFDISILELDSPITKFQLACLPNPNFDDSNQTVGFKLAGYGQYQRERCMTNKYGKAKFHYCVRKDDCKKEKPPPQDKICDKFLNEHGPLEQDEAMIISDKKVQNCFSRENPENASYGWCTTVGDYYDLAKPELLSKSWGYCSKDCFLSNTHRTGVLRIKENVMVLSEKRCSYYLNWTIRGCS